MVQLRLRLVFLELIRAEHLQPPVVGAAATRQEVVAPHAAPELAWVAKVEAQSGLVPAIRATTVAGVPWVATRQGIVLTHPMQLMVVPGVRLVALLLRHKTT